MCLDKLNDIEWFKSKCFFFFQSYLSALSAEFLWDLQRINREVLLRAAALEEKNSISPINIEGNTLVVLSALFILLKFLQFLMMW